MTENPFGAEPRPGLEPCRCGRMVLDESDEPDPYCAGCGLVPGECECPALPPRTPGPLPSHTDRKLQEMGP